MLPNIFTSATTAGTTTTVTGLPNNGSTLYVRLSSLIGLTWYSHDYTYKAVAAVPASITSPVNGSTLTGTSQTFTWNNAGANLYQVFVGTSVGALDIGASSQTTGTSATVTGLPNNGSTLYVRLWSLIGLTWSSTDFTYTASSLGPARPTSLSTCRHSQAQVKPLPGIIPGSLYQVFVGTSVGAVNIGASAQTTGTSATVNGLPTNGSTVYVRLWSLIGLTWVYTDYTYTASTAAGATITSPYPARH